MALERKHIYEFGPFRLDPEEHSLFREGRPVPLFPKAFDALVALVESHGHLIKKDELMKKVWPETFVGDSTLTFNISVLRKVLGDDRQNGNKYIETVQKYGYRFVAPVSVEVRSGRAEVRGLKQGTGGEEIEFGDQAIAPGLSLRLVGRQASRVLWMGTAAVTAAILAYALRLPLPAPRVLAYHQLTNDSREKLCGGRLVTDGLRVYFSEMTPEGCAIAWVSAQGGEVARILIPLRNVTVLDISPDRSELLIGGPSPEWPGRSLWILPLSGGSLRRLENLIADSASWSPDGREIAFANDQNLYLANSDGTKPRKVAKAGSGYISTPRFHPDGNEIRFVIGNSGGLMSLWDAKPLGTNPHRAFPGWKDSHKEGEPLWTEDGKYSVFKVVQNNRADIWAVCQHAGFLHRIGHHPVQLTAGPLSLFAFVLSPNNRKLFVVGEQQANSTELVRYDSGLGEFTPYLGGISAYWVSFSRGGHWVAYLRRPGNTLWRMRQDGSDLKQLTFLPMDVDGVAWSPDGNQIAFRAKKPHTPYKIYVISALGGEPGELLPQFRREQGVPSWSPDGKQIAFGDVPPEFGHGTGNEVIHLYDVRTHRLSSLSRSKGLWTSRWSPDGRYIAGLTIAKQELVLFDLKSGTWRNIGLAGIDNPTWSHDGKYIYFDLLEDRSRILRIRVTDGKLERIAALNTIRRATWWIGLAPDDSPLVVRDIGTQEIYALDMEWP